VFERLLGPRSFDSLERPLAYKQVDLPITLGGIGFILTSSIIPITYLWNWAFIVSIIIAMFMVDQHSFLFKVLGKVDNNTSKATYHLLLPPT
jgi:hypothetical protein